MSTPADRRRSAGRSLLASLLSVALALGGATLVLGCSGGTTTTGGAVGVATAAPSMPGPAMTPTTPVLPPAATEPAATTPKPANQSHTHDGMAHGLTTVQLDASWTARPAYVRDNGAAISEAYAFALADPVPLESMPCYCGCVATDHRSNLDCFFRQRATGADPLVFEEHASYCGICIDTALLTKHRLAEGATLTRIRAEVDSTIGSNGVEGTHTALPPAA